MKNSAINYNMKKAIPTLLIAVSCNCLSSEAANSRNIKTIQGGDNSSITFRDWSDWSKAWKSAEYKNPYKKIAIYKTKQSDNVTSQQKREDIAISTTQQKLSPSGRYILINRSQFGALYLEDGSTKTTEVTHCDVIDMKNGCLILTRPAEYCSGTWSDEKWIPTSSDYQAIDAPTLETPSPAKIIKQIKNIGTPTDKAESAIDYMYMGTDSYLSCYPPTTNNVRELNDIAFFLAEGGDNYNALNIYRALEKVSPSRIVLKLNIADALWETNKHPEAKKYYSEYKEKMEHSGCSRKIPTRVTERLKKP